MKREEDDNLDDHVVKIKQEKEDFDIVEHKIDTNLVPSNPKTVENVVKIKQEKEDLEEKIPNIINVKETTGNFYIKKEIKQEKNDDPNQPKVFLWYPEEESAEITEKTVTDPLNIECESKPVTALKANTSVKSEPSVEPVLPVISSVSSMKTVTNPLNHNRQVRIIRKFFKNKEISPRPVTPTSVASSAPSAPISPKTPPVLPNPKLKVVYKEVYRCNYCNMPFDRIATLNIHIVNTGHRHYKCPFAEENRPTNKGTLCGASFSRKHDIKNHLETAHQGIH